MIIVAARLLAGLSRLTVCVRQQAFREDMSGDELLVLPRASDLHTFAEAFDEGVTEDPTVPPLPSVAGAVGKRTHLPRQRFPIQMQPFSVAFESDVLPRERRLAVGIVEAGVVVQRNTLPVLTQSPPPGELQAPLRR